MVGCYAIADSSQTIRTDLDNELEDARWFTREEVLLMLSDGPGLKKKEMRDMGRQVGDQKLLAPAEDSKASPGSDSESDGEDGAKKKRRSVVIRVPGKQAIAGVLIYKWAHRQLDGLGYSFIPAKQRM
ncbi:hypothetical protein DL93DRAFT_1507990 [Clavulina sp. PMI_390]|nr:hypothetical protein DL93DRAFT_1507990 [Clavulina sp. PMI_390]